MFNGLLILVVCFRLFAHIFLFFCYIIILFLLWTSVWNGIDLDDNHDDDDDTDGANSVWDRRWEGGKHTNSMYGLLLEDERSIFVNVFKKMNSWWWEILDAGID